MNIRLIIADALKGVAARVKPHLRGGRPVMGYVQNREERNENLRRWFSASKIRGEDGEPLVVYHATAADFVEFKPGGENPKLSGPALWFGRRKTMNAAHNTQDHRVESVGRYNVGTRVLPVYLRMANPLVLNDQTMMDWAHTVYSEHGNPGADWPYTLKPSEVAKLKADGYDGIVLSYAESHAKGPVDNIWEFDEYIVFDASQVKSALGNRGTFDAAEPDITKSWKLKGRHREAGLDIAIENPKGDVRHWHNNETGEDGSTTMEYPYGFIRNTWGLDNEEVDIFVGDLPFAQHDVHVVTTKRAPDFIHDDEQKVFMGFPSRAVAKQVFLRHYQSPKFFGSIDSMTLADFKTQALGSMFGGAVVGKGVSVRPHVRDGKLVRGYHRGTRAWISPTDEIHVIENEEHLDQPHGVWAMRHLGDGGDARDASDRLVAGGWIRQASTSAYEARVEDEARIYEHVRRHYPLEEEVFIDLVKIREDGATELVDSKTVQRLDPIEKATATARVKPHTRKGKPVRGYQQNRKAGQRKLKKPRVKRDAEFDAMMAKLNAEQDHLKAIREKEKAEAAARPKHERYAREPKAPTTNQEQPSSKLVVQPEITRKEEKPEGSFKPTSAARRWAEQAGEKLAEKPADLPKLPNVGTNWNRGDITKLTTVLQAHGWERAQEGANGTRVMLKKGAQYLGLDSDGYCLAKDEGAWTGERMGNGVRGLASALGIEGDWSATREEKPSEKAKRKPTGMSYAGWPEFDAEKWLPEQMGAVQSALRHWGFRSTRGDGITTEYQRDDMTVQLGPDGYVFDGVGEHDEGTDTMRLAALCDIDPDAKVEMNGGTMPYVPADDWFARRTDITDVLEGYGYQLSSGYQAGDSGYVYKKDVEEAELKGDSDPGITRKGPEGTLERMVIIDRDRWRVGTHVGYDTTGLAELLGIPIEEGNFDMGPEEDTPSEEARAHAETQTTEELDWEGTRPPDDYADLDNDDNAPPTMQRGWIDPGGHFHDLGMQGAYWHLDWLRHKGYGKGRHDNYLRMLDAGWVRTVDAQTYEVGSEEDFKRVAAFAQDRYGLKDGSMISVDVTTPIKEGEERKTTNAGQGNARVESVLVCVSHGREECHECFQLDKARHRMKSTTQWTTGYGDALRGADPASTHVLYLDGYATAAKSMTSILPALFISFERTETECDACGFDSPGISCEVCGASFASKGLPSRPMFPKGSPSAKTKSKITLDLHGLKLLGEVLRLVRGAVGRDGAVGARLTPEPEIAIVCPDFQRIEAVQKELQRLPDLCDAEQRLDEQRGVNGYHCSVKGVPLTLRTERIQKHAFDADQMDDGSPEMQTHLAEMGKHHELADHGIASRRPQPPMRRQDATADNR